MTYTAKWNNYLHGKNKGLVQSQEKRFDNLEEAVEFVKREYKNVFDNDIYWAGAHVEDEHGNRIFSIFDDGEERKNLAMLNLTKDEFLQTKFGENLKKTITCLDYFLLENEKIKQSGYSVQGYQESIITLLGKWGIYQLYLKEFYGIEYHFVQTDKYFGLYANESDNWLFKIDRKTYSCSQLG